MIYIALVGVVALGIGLVSVTNILRWHMRQAARREDLLVNQLCHLAGRPWQEAPSWTPEGEEGPTELWSLPEQQLVP